MCECVGVSGCVGARARFAHVVALIQHATRITILSAASDSTIFFDITSYTARFSANTY